METIDHSSLERTPILQIKQRWNFLAITLVLVLLSQGYTLYKSMQLNSIVQKIESGDTGGVYELQRLQTQPDPLTFVIGLVGVLCIIAVSVWFYRAGQNIHMTGLRGMKFSPGWYVGWFYIPLVQVVMPYLTTRELWQANASINNPDEYNSWKNNKISILVNVWYFSFVIRLLVGIVLMIPAMSYMQRISFDMDAAVAYFKQANYVGLFSMPLQTIEGIALLLFSKKITDAQELYRQQL